MQNKGNKNYHKTRLSKMKFNVINGFVFIFYKETKIQSMNKGIVRSLGVGRFLDWGAVDAEGTRGGILVF